MLLSFAEGIANEPLSRTLREVAGEQQASKRIEAVRDLLPPMLRGGSENPLGTIYGALSDHLHTRTEDECMAQAENPRNALDFLLGTLAAQEIEKRYDETLGKIAASRAPKKT